jgi:ABC-type transport system involved in cytochrome c biogenesis ATPase subunit
MPIADCINNACCNQLGHKQDIKNLISELEDVVWYAYHHHASSNIQRKLDEIKTKYANVFK